MSHSMNVHEFSSMATLIDGAEVTLRSLCAGDYDAVVALAADLSAEERYLRFFTAHPAHIGEWATSLTRPADGFVALGVFEAGELIGVANYAESSTPGCAEIAVVVAHEQHERGVGTALLLALGHIARDAGQHRFVADVLCENNAIRRVISDAGWPVTQHRDGSVLSVEVDLDSIDEQSYPID
ncbi:MAG TPA: GNAT family N-acetyltransferase [Mycobacterium sp.]|nr:GNAT family N-acetyltransferase [Mycobacterium sp.]